MTGENDRPLPASLLALADVATDHEARYEGWWDNEHLPQRLACPGVLGGKRWVALEGTPKHMTQFDMISVATRFTEPYLKISEDPSPESMAIAALVPIQRMIFVERDYVFDQDAPDRRDGLLLVTFDLAADLRRQYLDWHRAHDQRLIQVPGVCRIRRFTSGEAGTPGYGVLIEFTDPGVVDSEDYLVRRSDAGREALAEHFVGFRRWLFRRAQTRTGIHEQGVEGVGADQ